MESEKFDYTGIYSYYLDSFSLSSTQGTQHNYLEIARHVLANAHKVPGVDKGAEQHNRKVIKEILRAASQKLTRSQIQPLKRSLENKLIDLARPKSK